MSLAKRLFPRPEDARKRQQVRSLQTGLAVGVICSGLLIVVLWLIYHKQLHP